MTASPNTPDMSLQAETAFLVALAEHGISPDVQELLVHGDGRGSVAPGALRKALAALEATPSLHPEGEGERRFWLIVHEPGMVPVCKGSWPATDTKKVLREFIDAYPAAYLHVLTIGPDGTPDVDHGPEVLQMLDGRSMVTGRKHNDRTLAAHSAALTPSTVTEGTVPDDGWVMVPRVLTDEMAKAGAKGRQNSAISSFRDGWKFALAAAPASPKPTIVEASGMVEGHAKVHRLIAFMAEQTEREAVVDWLRKVGDSKPHGTDWRAYYEAAEAIETEQHRKALSASSPSSEQGRG